jgi:hypothetical protein
LLNDGRGNSSNSRATNVKGLKQSKYGKDLISINTNNISGGRNVPGEGSRGLMYRH